MRLSHDRLSMPASAASSACHGLEAWLGNPLEADRPCSHAEALRCDEQGQLSAQAEAHLDAWGFNAEFVPVRLGGRWLGVDTLARRLRPVFRRDAALGLGYGVTSMMAALNVWCAGSQAQQRDIATRLLKGQRLAVAYHELEHGNDFMRNAFDARRDAGGYVLSGHKQVINNAGRADAVVLFARTDARPGGRSHSLFALDRHALAHAGVSYLPRYASMGVRGCRLEGLHFEQVKVADDALLGEPGFGAEIALRSFQVSRIALPGMALGMLDTAMRTVFRFICRRRLYGASVADFPLVQEAMAKAFIHIQMADCLVVAAARCLHLSPSNASMQAAAVKYLAPRLLEEAMQELAVVLGARFYLRGGEYAIFGKMLRDLPVISLGHAGGMACLLTIVQQLTMYARRGTRRIDVPPALYADSVLPELEFSALGLLPAGGDALIQTLIDGLERLEPDRRDDWRARLDGFHAACKSLQPSECAFNASVSTFNLAESYACLIAAGSCMGFARSATARGDTLLASPAWMSSMLWCLEQRVRGDNPALPTPLREALFAEALERYATGHSFCLDRESLA